MHVNSIETILKIVFSLHERTHYALHQLNQSSMHKLINILLENARIKQNICNATEGNNIKHLDYMQFWRDRCDQTNGKSVYGLKLAPFSRHWLLLMLFERTLDTYQWRVHHFSFIFDAVHLIMGNTLAMCKSLQLQAIWKFKFQLMKIKQTFADLSILIGW